MAERLGEALLDLRVNSGPFDAGIAQAEGRAQKLGSTLDKTSGSSAKLATEMVTTGRSAAQMGAGFEQAGQRVVQSAGAQRAGMQQLSFQLNDMATMFALGARPMQIFASQSGQVIQSLQMMAGGTSRVAAFLGGPWGIAITSAAVVLAPFIGKLFEAEDALKGVEFASDNLGEAQSILRTVIDTTTGALDRQRVAAIELAKAQALVGIAKNEQAIAGLKGQLGDAAQETQVVRGPLGIPFFTSRGLVRKPTESANVVRGVLDGSIKPGDGTARLRGMRDAGSLPNTDFLNLQTVIANLGQEGANLQGNKALDRFVNGKDTAADREMLGIKDLVDTPRARGGRQSSRGPKPRTGEQKQDDFDTQTVNLDRQTLQARLTLATSAQERADIQRDLISLEREQQVAQIEATDLTRAMKDTLIKQVEALLGAEPKFDEQGNLIVTANRGLEGEIIARELSRRTAEDAQALADEKFRGETQALQNLLALADTQAAQKDIALRIYDAQVEEERLRLQKIIDLEATGEVEKKEADLARQRLANLNANAASGRAAVSQQNETDVQRYMRLNINQTPGMINEALDGIKIDGLEALNDGLTNAIMGAESLGDVFKRVADQIIADLLRIAIQQAIIKPLANALFGGGGGGGIGGFLGSLLGGAGSAGGGQAVSMGKFVPGKATGGTIPTGKFAIVGEEGPEIAFAGPGGMGIMSNPASRALLSSGGGGSGTSVNMPITIDATGADAAAIARLNSRLDQLQGELPGRIVNTIREARDRRILT